jgi:hypothetical protein
MHKTLLICTLRGWNRASDLGVHKPHLGALSPQTTPGPWKTQQKWGKTIFCWPCERKCNRWSSLLQRPAQSKGSDQKQCWWLVWRGSLPEHKFAHSILRHWASFCCVVWPWSSCRGLYVIVGSCKLRGQHVTVNRITSDSDSPPFSSTKVQKQKIWSHWLVANSISYICSHVMALVMSYTTTLLHAAVSWVSFVEYIRCYWI